jgi:hypothetical protein
MLRPTPVLFAICALFSCSENSQDLNLQKTIKNDTSAKAGSIVFAEPQIIDSSHIIIYPLVLERSTYGSGFSSGSGGESTIYWNLLFFNTETNQKHLLFQDKRIAILSINSNEASSYRLNIFKSGIDIYKDNIFYEVIAKDYDQNGILNRNDPTYIFVSDKQGNNFRQLSPENFSVESWSVVKGTNKIILQARKDDNNDKRFDQNDAIIPLIVDVTSGKLSQMTFDQSYIDSLKGKLTKIWKIDNN